MEPIEIIRTIFALSAVLGLIGISAFAAKRLGLAGGNFKLARTKRLSLIETLPLDKRRKAAIIRVDSAEHLVVLNPNSVTVVARNLKNPQPAGDLQEAPADEANPVLIDALATLKTFSENKSSSQETPTDEKVANEK